MVAVPESAGVHWKTRSGALPELPQLPACELAPLVVPLKVPPWAGIAVGLPHAPASVVVVEVVVSVVTVDVVVAGGIVVVVVVVGARVVVVVVVGVVAGKKVASTMFQLVAEPKLRLPCWGPAALDRMSARSDEALPFWTSRRDGTSWLVPAMAGAGSPPVRPDATARSP